MVQGLGKVVPSEGNGNLYRTYVGKVMLHSLKVCESCATLRISKVGPSQCRESWAVSVLGKVVIHSGWGKICCLCVTVQ